MEELFSVTNFNFVLVFLEGIVSFFSPCILPLLPLYISYLAGNAKIIGEDGSVTYKRGKVFLHTLFFVLGISFAFFILGLSFSTLGSFFNSNKAIFTKIGGIFIFVMGLIQLGVIEFNFMKKERRLALDIGLSKMNFLKAFILGFTFSFAWTPCVGPALASVLVLASGAQTALTGNLLVLVYSLGFVLPFLFVGIFTTSILNFIKKNQKLLNGMIKVGGVILVVLGIMTFTGWINNVSGYLNTISPNSTVNTTQDENKPSSSNDKVEGSSSTSNESTENGIESEKQLAPDFDLVDQYGDRHKLSDYKGKVVLLNFWATWCPPCKEEMPDIEELYKEYNLNKDEVVILGVARPGGREPDKEGISKFLKDNNYTFPTVFDESGELTNNYFINAFPTTYMIDKDSNIFGYVPGMLSKSQMKSIIEQTIAGKQN
ncbi:cytochrome c biogenesis protein CcdA [uncultured Clostridium sp.]|uniref:redoxin domain-containing protein n=1 Tax=uncultured Clostridium sp. TaxID=59620 RepID=UPI0026108CB1|nr:cytochrome c biogenesis protein CcdA [uncultured Clostridium sp.]